MSDTNDNNMPHDHGEEDFVLIAAYTRAQALEDGMLVDVTERAKEAGIKLPTALTRAVWNEYVDLTEAANQACNDVAGRLWDIVWMFRCAALRQPNASELRFQLHVVTHCVRPSLVTLKAHIGPGDDGTPIITIMKPEED
jgi:hypothetical protein